MPASNYKSARIPVTIAVYAAIALRDRVQNALSIGFVYEWIRL